MTQDEIIEMARQAGIDIGMWKKLSDNDDVFGYDIGGTHENLVAFAKLVAAKEREACAEVLEDASKEGRIINLTFALKAIRARGQA